MPIHDWSRVDAGIFHDFHFMWIARLRTVLNGGLLPDRFYALAEPVLGDTSPDILTIEGKLDAGASDAVHEHVPDTAVAVASERMVVQELDTEAYGRLQRQIVVKDTLRRDRVVAVIEIVSASNKGSTAKRDRFIEKTLTFLSEGIHVLLVDLQPPTKHLHAGFHAPICEAYLAKAAPLPGDRPLQVASYSVRAGGTVRSHVVPLRVGDEIPEMPLFLFSEEFVRIPLEPTYADAFGTLPRRFREELTTTTP